MIFTETNLAGAFIIKPELHHDERGFFARVWCREEFAQHHLNSQLAQCNISFNKKKGTIRGMHYQMEPYAEDKVVSCVKGAIYDVIIDLRPQSTTFKQWLAMELTEQNREMLYIPQGFAHGFQTLTDNTEIFYQMSEFYHSECAMGVRWNDPAFQIVWPLLPPTTISERDKNYPDYH